ncbi:G-type lectin S-receptor-like serine/threonine-protein kinase LECRK4, partial [Linum perenne]
GGIGNDVVAVKKLDKLTQEREKEFKAEVHAIGRTHHRNLVRLLGASLKLDWHHRVRISTRIARGLVYLYEECRVPIVHCDIKPHNVRFDGSLTAKVYDFGMAKLMMAQSSDQTKTVNIRGTRGVGDLLVVGGEEDQVAAIDGDELTWWRSGFRLLCGVSKRILKLGLG